MDNILDEIYEKLDNCQHYGSYLAAVCIFHDDSRPSLMIYPDRYRCLSCSASGTTESLLKRLSKSAFQPKLDKPDFSNPFTKWTRNKSLGQALKISHLTLKDNPSMGSYLRDRCIPYPLQKELGIGYRDDWYTFPIRNEEHLIVGAIARKNETNKHPAKYIIPSGQNSNLLYTPNWITIKSSNVVFLTFGIMDAISIYQCGYAALSTTTGKRLDPIALDKFRKRIVIFPDKGEDFEAVDIASELGWRGKVYRCEYTFDAKDPNDLFVKHPEDLKAMLKGIVSGL